MDGGTEIMRLKGQTIVVAGGTGNVGSHIVRALLTTGARVAVPSRSAEKIAGLRGYLAEHVREEGLSRLETLVGTFDGSDVGSGLGGRIVDALGTPTGVVASLGHFAPARSLADTDPAALRGVLEDYPVAHLSVARALLPVMSGGVYLFINGPLAFEPWKGSGAHLVSVATAAQHMLFRALAQELTGGNIAVAELVVHTYLRRRETQPGSAVPGDAVGAYVCHLLERGSSIHGRSLQLDSLGVLHAEGVPLPRRFDAQVRT